MRSGDGSKKEGEINFRGKGFGTFNEFMLLLPQPFFCKEEKDEKKKPHTVTVREVLRGQSITNQSLKVLVLLLEDVLHYLQTFNVVTDVRVKVCKWECVNVCVVVIIHGISLPPLLMEQA